MSHVVFLVWSLEALRFLVSTPAFWMIWNARWREKPSCFARFWGLVPLQTASVMACFSFPLVGYFWDTCLGEDASGFADGEFFLEVQGVLSGIFGGGLFLFEDGVHAPAIQFLFPEVVDFGFCFDELGYYFWVMAEWERGSFEVALRFFGDCLAIGWVVFGGDFGDSFFELRLDFFLERFLLRS